MSRRLRLPVVEAAEAEAGAPTPEALRRALGGRLAGPLSPRVGGCVCLADQPDRPLVVLFADDLDAHLWVGQGRVRRAPLGALLPFSGSPPADLAAVARDIARFAALAEGAPVAFLPPSGGPVSRGILAEKCRFGALVARDGGALLGVGFRRLWGDDPAAN